MGKYALISEQSIFALIPLVVYLTFVFSGRKALTATLAGVIVGCIITAQNPGSISGLFATATGSFLGIIGFIIMLGSGLGEVMAKSGVSHTIVRWIIDKIGVNSEKKGILAVIVSSTVICALLGTLAGGNAIIAPIIIPVVASVGLTPSTVGAIFQTAGETGLIWGPFTGPVVALLAVTGLSYGKMMLWAAIPFGIIWLVVIYFVALRIQKKTKDVESYNLSEIESAEVEILPEHRRTTIAFTISFIILMVYGIIKGLGTNYAIFVMFVLTIIIAVFSKIGIQDSFEIFYKGMAKMTQMYLIFILLSVMLDLINIGGGFEALGEYLMVLVDKGGRYAIPIVGSFVGAFGISGAAVAEIQITHELFAPAVNAYNIPMEVWAIALIAASRITTSIYPTANMVGQMGLARSNNIKWMLFAGWTVSMIALLYICIWSVVGLRMFF